MNPSPFALRQRPSQGEGNGSRSSASEPLSTCMDTQALVAWARGNQILEKDCIILEANGYTGLALLQPWNVVKPDLHQDEVSRGSIALLRKLTCESNDPRGAWSISPRIMPRYPPNTYPQPPRRAFSQRIRRSLSLIKTDLRHWSPLPIKPSLPLIWRTSTQLVSSS